MIKLVASDLDALCFTTISRLCRKKYMIRLKHFMKKESSSLPQADASMPISAGFSLLSALTFHISLKMVPCASIKKKYSPPV